MYRFIFLCTLFFQAQAADHGSDLISNALMMQRLKEAEENSQPSGENKFVYKTNSHLGDITAFMQERGAPWELDHLKELAASELSDEQKVSKLLVCTNYFKQLSDKNQQEKDTALRLLLGLQWAPYPVERLVFAGLAHIGASMNVKHSIYDLCRVALLHDDIPLVKLVLLCGAAPDQNKQEGGSVLMHCQSVGAAQLMLDRGDEPISDVRSSSGNDLVYLECCTYRANESNELLHFYLQGIPLSESNQFGLKYMEAVERCFDGSSVDYTIDRVRMLLEHKCKYTEEIKSKICKKVGEKSPEAKVRIEQLFTEHEVGGKNVKRAKR